MAEMLTWSVNGVELPSVSGDHFATDTTTWRPGAATVRHDFQVPGRHGSLEFGNPVFSEPLVTIVAKFRYASLQELEERVGRWLALVSSPTVELTRTVGDLATTAEARLVSVAHDEFKKLEEHLWTSKVTVIFGVLGAFFSEPAEDGAALPFSADIALAELPHLAGSTAPVTDAVVRVAGPVTYVEVTDPLSATGISWEGDLAAGQYLFLDAQTLRARISTSATQWATGGADATIGLSYPSAGPLQLSPIVSGSLDADSVARISAVGSGRSAATTLTVRASRSYL